MGIPSLVLLLFPMILISESQLCSNWGTYSANSPYSKNLNTVLSSLPSNITENGGFYNATAGHDPDKVYASSLCRGDLSSNRCYKCINSTIQGIIEQCPNQKEAIMWGDATTCMIRYSNRKIFGRMELTPSQCVPNPNNKTGDYSQFNETLYDLMGRLTTHASSGSSGLKFATGSSDGVFGLVQCSPDISKADCSVCLQGAMGEGCGFGMEGGRLLSPSCILWFENFKFYDSTADTVDSSQVPPTPVVNSPPPIANFSPPSQSITKGTSQVVSKIIVPIIVTLVILITITCALLRKRLKHKVENDDTIKRLESLQFEFSIIKAATDNFSDNNKLGQGGFGSVYKGVLPNGRDIAVKRLSECSAQGEEEFKNEILLVAKLQHRNLVSLLGFCSEGTERILVYEFARNGSLDHVIFDATRSAQLNWEMRYKIINGIARGILYLHEDSRLKIIHRDLKANNVLLDEEMNPKISDFGLARLFVLDQTQCITRRVAGTYGYMAPEYASQNRFSAKSDVFSFGVLVLEIVTGKKNSWLSNSNELEHLLSQVFGVLLLRHLK
ncbi:cysteine-rich receptor-like protein kinase 26 isoform X3 [Manihot esculenta]|uniref:cysteine-rich receptor-like protein kinase 26 isoform X3 n=1 Tax=Manihot esculenta TaxID=3983 RepID=UPI000B5D5BBF|nr:cysteine-rich receptor-like protein kinase 26 isoform X3 [Manihot esculenta]